jgi:hypothetical protein
VFDAPLDAWYVWLGLAAVATAATAAALAFPTAPPPDAAAAAGTVDEVAGHNPPASATHRLAADAVRPRPSGLALRSSREIDAARFAFGPVLPVRAPRLVSVAAGTLPRAVFDRPSAFAAAVAHARERVRFDDRNWWHGSTLLVHHVAWGGEDVTLVAVR